MHYNHLKALIVDDVETVRLVLKKTLGELDITKVDEAPSVDFAWDLLNFNAKNDDPFDIVFCDYNMPMADGNELLKRIRESSEHAIKYMKFVMVTGSDHKVAESMDLGAHNIIHKPFDKKFIKFKLDLIYKSYQKPEK
jgi:two-component system chemotaxis response regulator CheY